MCHPSKSQTRTQKNKYTLAFQASLACHRPILQLNYQKISQNAHVYCIFENHYMRKLFMFETTMVEMCEWCFVLVFDEHHNAACKTHPKLSLKEYTCTNIHEAQKHIYIYTHLCISIYTCTHIYRYTYIPISKKQCTFPYTLYT